MAPSLKLWYSPGACSLAVHIVLRRTKLAVDTVRISVRDGAPEHLRQINPKMRVPVLAVDDDWVITEVPAIMTAIDKFAPEHKILGRTDKEVVQAYEWMNWLSGILHERGFGMVLRPARFTNDVNLHQMIQSKGQEVVREAFDYIEEKLVGVHAVGDAFTVVDAYLYVFYTWGARDTSSNMSTRYPKYSKVVAELSKDPALREAVDVEGLGVYDPTVPQ